jgi:hypothetical protein
MSLGRLDWFAYDSVLGIAFHFVKLLLRLIFDESIIPYNWT